MLPLRRTLSSNRQTVKRLLWRCDRWFRWQATTRSQKSQPKTDANLDPSPWEPVIGLEVHAQIQSTTKLFSAAPASYLGRPNCHVAHFDLSLPGTLPVLNRIAVETAIRTGLSLGCTIARKSTFDRKHYFYGDMPNGYQITQQRQPIAQSGAIEFIVYDEFNDSVLQRLPDATHLRPYMKRCDLKQIQLEQDSGKSLVDTEANCNLIDLNRAGVALMEFVFEPQLHSALEAVALVRELVLCLQAVGACNCRMDQGALRVDANVSLRPVGSSTLGTRTEIKNLNSFRFLREAIDYEIGRQVKLLEAGEVVTNETLGFDFSTKQTYLMRDKEIVQDYRFMPEPNLPPILLVDSAQESSGQGHGLIDVDTIRRELPLSALPQSIRARLLSPQFGLTLREVFFLLFDADLRQLFLDIFAASRRQSGVEVFSLLHQLITPQAAFLEEDYWLFTMEVAELKTLTSAEHLAELVDLLNDGRIAEPTVYDILKLYRQKDCRRPSEIAQQFNWWLIKDEAEIEAVCREVVTLVPKIAKKFAKTGIRRPQSMLIQKAHVALGNRVNEEQLWDVFERILRKDK